MKEIRRREDGSVETIGPTKHCPNCDKLVLLKNGMCQKCGFVPVSPAEPTIPNIVRKGTFCPHCGAQNQIQNFCSACGHKLQ